MSSIFDRLSEQFSIKGDAQWETEPISRPIPSLTASALVPRKPEPQAEEKAHATISTDHFVDILVIISTCFVSKRDIFQ
jgi:hypothetical protein